MHISKLLSFIIIYMYYQYFKKKITILVTVRIFKIVLKISLHNLYLHFSVKLECNLHVLEVEGGGGLEFFIVFCI